MEQHVVIHGQISRKMPCSEASKEGVYVPSPPRSQEPPEISQNMHFSEILKERNLQHAQMLPEYTAFAAFHQHGQQRPLEASQPHPSLSLSLERPDMYGATYPRAYQEAPVRPPFAHAPFDAEPSVAHLNDVLPHGGVRLDLEQRPFQHSEQKSHGDFNVNLSNVQGEGYQTHRGRESAGAFGGFQEAYQTQQSMETGVLGGSCEQANSGMHFQLAPATENPPHDENEQLQYYPPASASHVAVVQDPQLFMTTLENFLAALGTSLTIPKVEGLELNLHTFYCEVTARGGLVQVIRLGQWKELSQVLGISKFSLSMPYILRKHYMGLLFHYEQVYYFRMEGQLVVPPVPLPAPGPVQPAAEVASPYEAPPEVLSILKKRKRKLDPLEVFGVDPASSIGTVVTGAISGKSEEGYFVTVLVGAEKLSGVMYHVSSDGENKQFASVPSLLGGIGSEENTAGLEVQLYGKVRKEPMIRKRDPNGPKRTRTGYNIYFKEQREKLSQLYPDTKGLGKKVIEMWGKLSDNEKAPYVARGNQEREKYLTEFHEKMKLQPQAAEAAVNIGRNEPVGEHDPGAYYVSHNDYHVSLEPESDFQSEHPQISEMDQVYHAYHPNGPQSHPSDTEMPGDHSISEHTYEMQEDEVEYNQEPGSDEDEDDAELEENYEGEEDETAYPTDDYEVQDGGEYQVAEKRYSMQEGSYAFSQNESLAPESKPHGASMTQKQPYYGQDHQYAYTTPVPQKMVGSQGSVPIKSMGQSPYRMQENGKVVYPHIQPAHSEASGELAMPPPHYFTQGRYAYAAGKRELTMPQEQPVPFHRPEDVSSYSAPFHQNQSMASGIQMRQVPPEQVYQERYAYPMHLPHVQLYARPPTQGYPLRFPHAPYPMSWTEAQAVQYGHGYAPQIHQPQASVPEVSGVTPPSQAYSVHEGGSTYQG